METLESIQIVVSRPIRHPEQLVRVISQGKCMFATLAQFSPKVLVAGDWQFPIESLLVSMLADEIDSLLVAVKRKLNIPSLSQEQQESFETFCQNNLNISETSRSLFLHRNTMLYRLDRLKELTGLDPRRFEDAMLLRFWMLLDNSHK